MKPLAIAAVLAATLTLTACGGDAPQTPAETTTTPAEETAAPAETEPTAEAEPAAEEPIVNVEVNGDATVPGTDMTVDEAVQSVQQQVEDLQLNEAEKRQAVVDARTQAEAAAKAAGMTDEQVKQAGDAAEAAAKTMFGIE
ncbi:MAG: hypothetical protein KIT02_07865 [Devosia sp.]|uniref:hypothetical protein n=1 Tax=Devosia sp. TaxID=1871048 RepID=UPI0024CC074D|nr:hypothetical protein [Devosia sp.]UYO01104.1 MAG: hypothetical protein KIT02_07865 [Devosia sp.]